MTFSPKNGSDPEPGSEAVSGPPGRASSPSPSGGNLSFLATSWTQLLHAPFCPETLNGVITRYEPAARAWCRAALGQEGEEVFQQFMGKLLGNPNPLGSLRRERGRFRDWLKQALRNEWAGLVRRESRQKRGGGQAPVVLDTELQGRIEDASAPDPAEDFDRRYAARVMELVTEQLFSGLEKGSVEEAIARIMFGVDEATVRGFCADHGISSRHFHKRRDELRGRFQTLLRREVAASLCDPDEEAVSREIEELKAILRNARR